MMQQLKPIGILLGPLIFTSIILGADSSSVHYSGDFLGLFDALTPVDAPDTLRKNRQFDAAANVDILWKMNSRIRGNIQLQMGSGFGALSFAISSIVVTDLNMEIDIHPRFYLTLGSFDTPFGTDTPYLTNNASSQGNSFFLNTLFYGAFAGTDLGTLNTLGIKGEFLTKQGRITAAITNGTDESALNPDGNFGFVLSGISNLYFNKFQGGLALIYSADSSKSGSSGTRTHFSGILIDGSFEHAVNKFLKAYFGAMNYDDKNQATSDVVLVWKIEARYPVARGYIGARISSWLPSESDTSRSGVVIPEAGTGWRLRQIQPLGNQKVFRYQLGFGWPLSEDLIIKTEIFYDDHRKKFQTNSIDVLGIILGLNAHF